MASSGHVGGTALFVFEKFRCVCALLTVSFLFLFFNITERSITHLPFSLNLTCVSVLFNDLY